MSRSGYTDDIDNWQLIRWRGAVASAIRGQRGQRLLRDMLAALDAMPVKRLIAGELDDGHGEYCALGALFAARGITVRGAIEDDDHRTIAERLDTARALVAEIAFQNDEGCFRWRGESPEERFVRMRNWCLDNIKADGEK